MQEKFQHQKNMQEVCKALKQEQLPVLLLSTSLASLVGRVIALTVSAYSAAALTYHPKTLKTLKPLNPKNLNP